MSTIMRRANFESLSRLAKQKLLYCEDGVAGDFLISHAFTDRLERSGIGCTLHDEAWAKIDKHALKQAMSVQQWNDLCFELSRSSFEDYKRSEDYLRLKIGVESARGTYKGH